MKRVLLTGGAGSIGVHVMGYFLRKTDWHMVIIDSFRHRGYAERLRYVFNEYPEYEERVTVIQHDLVCPINGLLKAKIGTVDYILHLAAISDVQFSVENPSYVIRTNVESSLTIFEYASETPHEAFVYFSTDEVYGPVEKGQAHAEWSTHRPSNPYSASKAMCEDLFYQAWRSRSVKLILTNTMNNFAPMQSAMKFPVIVQKKLAAGEQVVIHGNEQQIGTRFYIHSLDSADALLYILKNFPPHVHKVGELDEPDRYHIVGDEAVDNLKLAQMIANIMDKPLEYVLQDFHKDNPAHDIHYGLQDNKLRAAGWKPSMTLEEGLRRTIQWQQKHKEWIE